MLGNGDRKKLLEKLPPDLCKKIANFLAKRTSFFEEKKKQYEMVLNLRKNGWIYSNISKEFGIPHTTVQRWCKGENNPKNTSLPWNFPKSLIRGLYWQEKPSITSIAMLFGTHEEIIRKWMKKLGIRRRSLSEARMKYPKTSFSGDLLEKACLVAARDTDVHACRNYKQIKVAIGTTHPATAKLFDELFSKYGHRCYYPRYDKKMQIYKWYTEYLLNRSFSFLLKKNSKVPKWILEDKRYFMAYLGTFIDFEGCVSLCKQSNTSKRLGYRIIINSTSREILEGFKKKLKDLGYNPLLTLNPKPEKSKINGKKPLWRLQIYRKSDVIKILSTISLGYEEKIWWRNLILKNRDGYWNKVQKYILQVRKKIRADVKRYIKGAEIEWKRRHPI